MNIPFTFVKWTWSNRRHPGHDIAVGWWPRVMFVRVSLRRVTRSFRDLCTFRLHNVCDTCYEGECSGTRYLCYTEPQWSPSPLVELMIQRTWVQIPRRSSRIWIQFLKRRYGSSSKCHLTSRPPDGNPTPNVRKLRIGTVIYIVFVRKSLPPCLITLIQCPPAP